MYTSQRDDTHLAKDCLLFLWYHFHILTDVDPTSYETAMFDFFFLNHGGCYKFHSYSYTLIPAISLYGCT